MSYILDALKRADAERERGAVPGLHAQPAAMALPDEPSRGPVPPWAWAAAGVGVALLAVLAWSLWPADRAVPGAPDEGVSAQAGQPVPREAAPMGQGMQPPAQGTPDGGHHGRGWGGSSPGPRPGLAPGGNSGGNSAGAADESPPPQGGLGGLGGTNRPHRSAPDARDDGAQTPKARSADEPKAARHTPASGQASSPKAATAEAPEDSTSAATRLYAINELPEHVRRNLPTLVIGGAMYSENPASRMLVINSQLFHEGDKLGPDLTLEEIKLKSAVLRYRTWRYGVTY